MEREAHHRRDYRNGTHHTWPQRKAYHLGKLYAAVRAVAELVSALRPVGPGLYRLDRPYLMPLVRDALESARPYLDDKTGDVWN